MEIRAEVVLNEKTSQDLILSFFTNFDNNNGIDIKEDTAVLSIVFNDKPPTEIIEPIAKCQVIRLTYGKTWKDLNEDLTQSVKDSEKEKIFDGNTQSFEVKKTSEESAKSSEDERISKETMQSF